MNSVSVERRDWTGCTENSVGSGPKLMVRATAPLKRSVLLRTQYWTPRYDGFPLVHEEKSFAETMTTRSLNPRSGWSAQPVIVDTRYEFQEPVGASDADTSRRTLPVVTSAMEANHRPLAVSKWTFDTASGRWFASIADVTTGSVLLEVSASDDPTGSWNAYRVATITGCADQPLLGFSDLVVIVSANDF